MDSRAQMYLCIPVNHSSEHAVGMVAKAPLCTICEADHNLWDGDMGGWASEQTLSHRRSWAPPCAGRVAGYVVRVAGCVVQILVEWELGAHCKEQGKGFPWTGCVRHVQVRKYSRFRGMLVLPLNHS